MKAKATLLPVLILAAAFALAQQQPVATSPSNGPTTDQQAAGNPNAGEAQQPSQGDPAGQPSSSDANTTTVRGCLGTGADHTYSVTDDKTGTVYTLAGKDFNSLSSHVGQEVEVDGQPTAGNAVGATSGSASDSINSSTTAFQVLHLRKVADKCTSAKPAAPPSSLYQASPILVAAAFPLQTSGSAGAQTSQPGTASPGASGSTSTSGMSTSPQTTTPGQSTPSTAMPTTPPPTTPGTVNTSTPGTATSPGKTATPGTAATPGAAGSSNANTTPGTQPPCAGTESGTAATSQTPCSTPNPTPEAAPGVTPDTTVTPGSTSPSTTPPATSTAPKTTTSPSSTTPPKN